MVCGGQGAQAQAGPRARVPLFPEFLESPEPPSRPGCVRGEVCKCPFSPLLPLLLLPPLAQALGGLQLRVALLFPRFLQVWPAGFDRGREGERCLGGAISGLPGPCVLLAVKQGPTGTSTQWVSVLSC